MVPFPGLSFLVVWGWSLSNDKFICFLYILRSAVPSNIGFALILSFCQNLCACLSL